MIKYQGKYTDSEGSGGVSLGAGVGIRVQGEVSSGLDLGGRRMAAEEEKGTSSSPFSNLSS